MIFVSFISNRCVLLVGQTSLLSLSWVRVAQSVVYRVIFCRLQIVSIYREVYHILITDLLTGKGRCQKLKYNS